MKNILSLYYSDPPCTAEELNRLINEMEECIRASLTDEEIRHVYEVKQKGSNFITLDVLESAMCRTMKQISEMRNGRAKITPATMRIVDLLHKRVTNHPELARTAVVDFLLREKSAKDRD